jgi:4-aminobutyrate aminotransferase-like enzyme
VNALDNSAAVFTSTPTSAAIFGMTGSTARENSVEAKITRLTTLRTGGMAALSTFHR